MQLVKPPANNHNTVRMPQKIDLFILTFGKYAEKLQSCSQIAHHELESKTQRAIWAFSKPEQEILQTLRLKKNKGRTVKLIRRKQEEEAS